MRIFYVALIIMVLAGCFIYTAVSQTEGHRAVASAVRAHASLRALNKAQAEYAKAYGGYGPSLRALGPPLPGDEPSASAAGLISESLATGVLSGYRFDYNAGAKNEKGQITHYEVCAYPTLRFWLRTEPANFGTDESGVIRYTWDDGCPGAEDPVMWSH